MSLILDPAEVAIDRTELDLMSESLMVRVDGISWGDSEVIQFKSELRRGELPSDQRIPNRIITIPIRIGPTNFDTARRQLQQKASLIQRDGGWLKRGRTSVGDLFADLVNATLTLPDSWLSEHRGVESEAVLVLEALPDMYGEESEQASLPVADYASELLVTIPNVDGDFPCRTRIVLTSNGTERGAIFSLRSRQSTATTTAIPYDPTDLTLLGATADNLDGTVTNSSLVDEWQSVLGSDIAGTGPMQHIGPHRIWMVCETSDPENPPRLRLEWHQGDSTRPNRTEYRSVSVPSGGTFPLDLGEAGPERAPGDQGWGWTLLARSKDTGGDLTVHRVYVAPVGEGYGRLIAAPPTSDAEILALDSMGEHTSGDLDGKTAQLGGDWGESGDAAGFVIPNPVDGWVHRTTHSDADINTGTYARLGTGTAANVQVQADIEVRSSIVSGVEELRQGLLARFVDTNNWLYAGYRLRFGDILRVDVIKRVAGTVTILSGSSDLSIPDLSQRTLSFSVLDDGSYTVLEGPAGGQLTAVDSASDSDLATGNALDDGGYGLYDAYTDSATLTRRYRNFTVRDPGTVDAVLYPNLPGQLRTDGYWRENPSGLFSPIPVLGQNPRLPVSGLEDRAVEVFIRPTTGNLSTTADELGNEHSVTVYSRPSYLTTP